MDSGTDKSCQLDLVTNAYSVNASQREIPIHLYQLSITLSCGSKQLPEHVIHRDFVSRNIRKSIMDSLVPQILGSSENRGSIVISTNLDTIYSTEILQTQAASRSSSSDKEGEFCFGKVYIESNLLVKLFVDIAIRYKRTFYLSQPGAFQEVVTAILHHQLAIDMIRFGANYFTQPMTPDHMRLDLISGLARGVSLSGIRTCTAIPHLVVVNCPLTYITQEHRLIDLLASFILNSPVSGIPLLHEASSDQKARGIERQSYIDSITGDETWWSTFYSKMRGFKCRARCSNEAMNLRFDLTDLPASDITFPDPINPENYISVVAFYRRLNLIITYPNLPCLTSRSPSRPYVPLEFCSLIQGQKAPIFRLGMNALNNLVAMTKQRPQDSKRMSSQAKDDILALCQRHLDSFGVGLSQDNIRAKGSTIEKPHLQYLDQSFKPGRDQWESAMFYQAMNLVGNWCVVNTAPVNLNAEAGFFRNLREYCGRFGFEVTEPCYIYRSKQDIVDSRDSMELIVDDCLAKTNGNLKLIMFVIDSSSTHLNRLIHLHFDEHPYLTATCLRIESIMNVRQHRSIFRTLVHKLNARLGGTNVTYHTQSFESLNLNCGDLMVIGLDVTHPDNELNGVSIVGCAYTYSADLFRHKSLVWPQQARVEIIGKIGALMDCLLREYMAETGGRLPRHIVVYRDGVSHEEFDKVRKVEIEKAVSTIEDISSTSKQPKSDLSYIIAQKRHTMRFYQTKHRQNLSNPPSGTLIDEGVVSQDRREFYLYSNISNHSTARPLHYHVLKDGLCIRKLQRLTYFLCFNFGKCSGTLSMPSSLRYAHNAAYDARNRVIAARDFRESCFYTSKFFC